MSIFFTQRKSKMDTYTKYEKARILGARALQLSMNAPLLMSISKEQLENISYDPLKIAEIEFEAGILPITIKRPFPKKEELEAEEDSEEIITEEEIPEEPKSEEEKKEEKVAKIKENKKETATEEEADEVEDETAEVEAEEP
jgi:DNA-directed RNA polymerase subunit K